MRKGKIIGKKGDVEVVEIFAAVSNTETNEGRGSPIDRTYHPNERQAKVAAIGIGVMGGRGDVKRRMAVRFKDGTMLLLHDTTDFPAKNAPFVELSEPTAEQVAHARVELARRTGTAKLSPEEKKALGLD